MMEGRFYEFGPFRLDANCRALFRGSTPVPLPPKVAETLVVLVQNAGQVVSKEELLRRIWPNTFIEEGSLTRTISILRKALEDGSGEEFVATLSKRGYRFTAIVNGTPPIGGQSTDLLTANGQRSKVPAAEETVQPFVEGAFRLRDRVCRKLNRATLDPLIMGDDLRYADNQVCSDVLVLFLHGLGLDDHDFEQVLARLPYRGISPTLYGCEPEGRGRICLSLADHVGILWELLRGLAKTLRPTIIVLVGFSMGADMGFELLLGRTGEPGPPVDAFLSLECNLCLDTGTIPQVLAGHAPEHPGGSVADLRRLSDSAGSLDQWLNIHEYLVRVLRKFQGDIGVLQRATEDIVRPFRETPGFETFAQWFRGARNRVQILRLVFPKDSVSVAALARLRLENLDSGFLGGGFPETAIHVSDRADHLELMSEKDVLRQVDALVAEVCACPARSECATSA